MAPLREGIDFGLLDRTPAVGGQVLRINAAGGPVGDLHLPLHGAHMADNAALAVAAVEALSGGRPLAADLIADAFEVVQAPARTERVRTSPPVVLDTCHNPHGARATMAAVTEAYGLAPLIGVVGMMTDKDVEGTLAVLAEEMAIIVCTQAASARAVPADDAGAGAGVLVCGSVALAGQARSMLVVPPAGRPGAGSGAGRAPKGAFSDPLDDEDWS